MKEEDDFSVKGIIKTLNELIKDRYTDFFDAKKERKEFMKKHNVSRSKSRLWRASTGFISLFHLVFFLFSSAMAVIFLLGLVETVKDVNYDYIEETFILVPGFLFVPFLVTCFVYYSIFAFVKIFPNEMMLMDYVELYDVSFQELENDFVHSKRLGYDIFWGEEYLFIRAGSAMNVMRISEIDDIHITMGARFFLLFVESDEAYVEDVMKYSIIPISFFILRNKWRKQKM